MRSSDLLFFVSLIKFTECSKILCIFGAPSLSHQVVFRPLTNELLRNGHELVIITALPEYPDKKIANLTEINIHEVTLKLWQETLLKFSAKSQTLHEQKQQMIVFFMNLQKTQMEHEEVQKLANDKSNQFDLIIIESAFTMFLVFGHIYNAPVILISSLGANFDNYEIMGASVHPLLYPPLNTKRLVNLTLLEKVAELYEHYIFEYSYKSEMLYLDDVLKELYGKDTPGIKELSNNVDLLFLNFHKIWDSNRPVPPSVVYLGAMHMVPPKELPQDLKTYLDSSKHGVIYFSFGTNVAPSLFSQEKLDIFLNVFAKLPYDIIWKWDTDDIPGRSENVKVMKWVPQADLLRHPNIKLFITQGGLQSTDESITAGVPFVGIPMIGDQWYNVEKYVQHKIGVKLEFDSLSEERLKEAIETVIGDDSYRKNVEKLRTIMYDQPQTSLERAVWWTEHVLRHGGAKHLRCPAANISMAEYFELNIVFTLLLVLLVFIILFLYIVRLLYYHVQKYITCKRKKD